MLQQDRDADLPASCSSSLPFKLAPRGVGEFLADWIVRLNAPLQLFPPVRPPSSPSFSRFYPPLFSTLPGNREKNSIAVLRTRQVFHSRPHLPASRPERPRREKMSCRNGRLAWGSASPAALNRGSSPRSRKLREGSMA